MKLWKSSGPGNDDAASVPQTISDRKWGRLRDQLPFPAEPRGKDSKDLARRTKFGHQRMRSSES